MISINKKHFEMYLITVQYRSTKDTNSNMSWKFKFTPQLLENMGVVEEQLNLRLRDANQNFLDRTYSEATGRLSGHNWSLQLQRSMPYENTYERFTLQTPCTSRLL
jgi:hypothetical protein